MTIPNHKIKKARISRCLIVAFDIIFSLGGTAKPFNYRIANSVYGLRCWFRRTYYVILNENRNPNRFYVFYYLKAFLGVDL